jgi:ribosomal peptide maturation radical SAM protein 1
MRIDLFYFANERIYNLQTRKSASMTKQSGKSTRPLQSKMVSLVSMPFKDLRHPPIQLGILQCCLERAGIAARSHSLELAFMEHLHAKTSSASDGGRLRIQDYQQVATEEFLLHLGDWIFKVPPYAEPSPEEEEKYIEHAISKGVSDDAIAVARRMKDLVPEYLETVAEELLSERPRVVGFSTVFQQNVASLVLSKILKIRNQDLVIVFGGGNCDGPMGQAIHECFPWVDFVVRGEGEKVLVELVTELLANEPISPKAGLCYRVEGRSVTVPQKSGPQVPIDEVPMPTYDDYFKQLARTPLRKELWPEVAILFESSRGCWWGAKHHCTFCGLNGSLMAFRSKPASRVAEEILSLAARYKILDFVAVDDIIDLRHIRELLPMLRASGADLTIFYETKANLNKDQLRAFQSAGVSAIQPGIESLSTPILQLMRKGVTSLQNIRLLKWCAEIGIKPAWNLLYGFPGEPPEEYERMAKLVPSLIHLEPPMLIPIEVERFSPYFEQAAEFGIEIIGPLPHYRFLYPLATQRLHNLAYDFEYRYMDGRNPETYVKGLAEAVKRWREQRARPGSLMYRRGPGFLLIEDRRPGLENANYRLDGIEAKIYLACDAGATPSEICRQLSDNTTNPLDAGEVERYLEELAQERLVYREGSRFLALATAMNWAETSDKENTPAFAQA